MANGRNINRALSMDPGSAGKYSAVESIIENLRGMFSENQENQLQYNIDVQTLNADIAKNEASALNAAGDDEVAYLKSQLELMKNSNLSPQDWANYFSAQELEMTTQRGKHAARGYASVFSNESRNNKAMQEVLQQIPNATTIEAKRKVQNEVNNMYINENSIFYKSQYKPKVDKLNTDVALYDVKETYKSIIGKVFDDFPQLEETTQGRESFYAAIDGSSDIAEVETKWNDVLSLFKSIHEVGTDEFTQFWQWLNSDDYADAVADLGEKLGIEGRLTYPEPIRRDLQGE